VVSERRRTSAFNLMRTVLVLGGYGFFGHRISAALASTASLRVLIGGRDLVRASTAARDMGLPVEHAVAVDAHAPHLAENLRRLQVDVLIHTAGPFQGQDYSVARAAIEARCHYMDLADGRQFVAGISSLSAEALAARVSIRVRFPRSRRPRLIGTCRDSDDLTPSIWESARELVRPAWPP